MPRGMLFSMIFFGVLITVGVTLWLQFFHAHMAELEAERILKAQKQVEAQKELEARVEALAPCLPAGLELSREYCDDPKDRDLKPFFGYKGVTIRKTLIRLGAYCKDGKIYDAAGKKIVFHYVYEWGGMKASPEQWKKHQEREKQEWIEIRELEKRYTVIKMWRMTTPH